MIRALILAVMLLARPGLADEAAWRALAEPGTVALMRHAEAPGTFDPEGFRLDDCATQRNLSDTGRAQARAVGEAIRRRVIAVDAVLTSQWCRCRETAELLGVAPVTPWPMLNSLRAADADREAQKASVVRLLADRAGEKLILVTHQFNITALTGQAMGSGDMLVVRPAPGGVEVVGRIEPP